MFREDSSRYKKFSRRAMILAGGQVALFGLLAGRMYQLQVLESRRYKMLADENRINIRLLPPPRGRILDRFGVPLATNRENFRVLLIAERTRDVDQTLDALGRLIPIADHERRRILKTIKKRRDFVPVTVQENLDWKKVSSIEVNAPDLPGVVIDVGQSREYPLGPDSSHLLGYVAPVSEKDKARDRSGDPLLELPGFRIGKSGIEKQHERRLRGKAGNSQLEVNALGRVIRELSRQEGQPGDDVMLTIDLGIQNLAIEKLRDKKSAAAVVMDVHTGGVIALASVPGYDPNAFNVGLTRKQWRQISRDPLAPLTNKAVSGLYAPGSTFKMIVAMAALEQGVVLPDHKVFCRGHVELGNARFHCWKKHGHGWMDLNAALQQSCDTYFYEIAKRVGIDKISEMGIRFGLGEATGIDLPSERGGLMPTAAWKKKRMGVPWQKGETLVAGIGQGFVLTTPLQLAVMTSRIASGKLVKPHLVRGIVSGGVSQILEHEDPTPLDISDEIRTLVMDGMNSVSNTEQGTAYRARIAEPGFELAGKTGTAQVKRISKHERETRVLKNKERPSKDRDHALFVAYAPVKNPRYAISVVVEHGGGGSKVAAPIARDILHETLKRDPSGYRKRDGVAGEKEKGRKA
ncbi:MAG: penicillin-binding protein 2 [Rhodospirillaceae bacterium]|nr:penicillin-binding protein 2 [Rhodospirillaceae bacterium]|tara:strand:- start:12205 stop:14103 length:1899 start_codon:yes stop_codon:yes gene_type:complete